MGATPSVTGPLTRAQTSGTWTSWRRCTAWRRGPTSSPACTLTRSCPGGGRPGGPGGAPGPGVGRGRLPGVVPGWQLPGRAPLEGAPPPPTGRPADLPCAAALGGQPLQGEELPHHEPARADPERAGLQGERGGHGRPGSAGPRGLPGSRLTGAPPVHQYVSEVVIGAPYSVTAELLDHFKVRAGLRGGRLPRRARPSLPPAPREGPLRARDRVGDTDPRSCSAGGPGVSREDGDRGRQGRLGPVRGGSRGALPPACFSGHQADDSGHLTASGVEEGWPAGGYSQQSLGWDAPARAARPPPHLPPPGAQEKGHLLSDQQRERPHHRPHRPAHHQEQVRPGRAWRGWRGQLRRPGAGVCRSPEPGPQARVRGQEPEERGQGAGLPGGHEAAGGAARGRERLRLLTRRGRPRGAVGALALSQPCLESPAGPLTKLRGPPRPPGRGRAGPRLLPPTLPARCPSC